MRIVAIIAAIAGLGVVALSPFGLTSRSEAAHPLAASAQRAHGAIASVLASLTPGGTDRPMSVPDKGFKLANRCGSTKYYCKNPYPVCCYSQSKGYYCVAKLSD